MTGQTAITTALTKDQSLLYGTAARGSEGTVIRDATFLPVMFDPITDRCVRKAGRPRLEWVKDVEQIAIRAAGDYTRMKLQVRSAPCGAPGSQEHRIESTLLQLGIWRHGDK